MKCHFPFVPTCVCVLCATLFVALGVWQVQRLEWKNNLQMQIDAAFGQPPAFELNEDDFRAIDKNTIRRGQKELNFDIAQSITMNGRIMNGKPAVAVMAPAHAKDLNKSVMVEIGCIEKISPLVFSGRTPVKAMVTGIVRSPRWSYFTPENNLAKGHWWRIDAAELMKYFHKPFYDTYLAAENLGQLIEGVSPCPIQKRLTNNHLSYAIFWFTAAVVTLLLWYLRFIRPQKTICSPHTET